MDLDSSSWRVRARPEVWRRVLACCQTLALTLLPACMSPPEGGAVTTSEGSLERDDLTTPAPRASDRRNAQVLPPLVAPLLARHRDARVDLGPHRIVCNLGYEVTPARPSPTPAEGQTFRGPARLTDAITLEFHPAPDGAPAWFRLEQRDSRGSMREVLWRAGRVDIRHDDRTWSHHAPEGELFEQWLDDAYRCVGESVELAGVGLDVRSSPDEELDAPRVTLSLRGDRPSIMRAASTSREGSMEDRRDPLGAPDATLKPGDGDASAPEVDDWRRDTIVTHVDGEVTLVRHGGPWARARLEVAWKQRQRDERGAVHGRLTLDARLDLIDARPAPPPPADSEPLPMRRRLTQEAQELLDGLAGR